MRNFTAEMKKSDKYYGFLLGQLMNKDLYPDTSNLYSKSVEDLEEYFTADELYANKCEFVGMITPLFDWQED